MLVILAGLALFFFVIDPFGLFRPKAHLQQPTATPAELATLQKSLKENARPPSDYITGLFDRHQIVFLGEMGEIREQAEFVANLIPALYRSGVHILGIEYALSADQQKIDEVLTAPHYDEKAVEKILFDRMVLWGFKEYADIFHAAWKLNSGLPDGAQPFRILGLNVRQEYQYLQNQNDATNPKVVKKVFANGVPDVRMADTIEKEIVGPGRKALIYTTIQHSFTRFRYREYEKKTHTVGIEDARSAGNIIRAAIGDGAITVLMHSPWPNPGGPGGMGYPVGGKLDLLLKSLPESEQSAGITVTGTPFGALAVKNQAYSAGYDSLTLGDMTTGYLFLGPIASYHPVTPIPDFIDAENLAVAVRDFPGPSINPKTKASDLNGFITRMSSTIGQALADFN